MVYSRVGFEQLLVGVVEDFGLPYPTTQHRVRAQKENFYLDFAYPADLVAIEMDSEEYHLDLEQFYRDRRRQNELVLLGWRFLRFTSRHLREDRRGVAKQLASALSLPFPIPTTTAQR